MNGNIAKYGILFLPVFLGMTGCREQGHPVEFVTGKVMYKGEPLSQASVSFHPKTSNGYVAVAETKADGTFTLITAGAAKSGALAGEYHVLVTKVIAVDKNGKPIAEEAVPEQRSTRPQMEAVPADAAFQRPQMQAVIPEKYGRLDKPLLDAVVVKGKNEFLFELDDQ
ncbi:MAG: hypothetical protein LBQ54_05875 [Planctomycetaceae bacterium]|jgi:hypothetical protein|nr:hypothetical protein [Planctomycetaceae bacterium]